MRNYDDIVDLHPSLMGTMSAIGATAVGAPVDTHGFGDCLAILLAGAVAGSGTGALHTLDIKIQESATPDGTGSSWSDITNRSGGSNTGTWDFDSLSISGTSAQMYMQKQYCRLSDANRSRYIRAHATLSGTVGLGAQFSVSFLLGRPNDTLYISNAETQATGNVEFYKGQVGAGA